MSESSSDPNKSRRERTLVRFSGGNMESTNDFLAVEEPLEIRVVYGAEKRKDRSLSITMRTPGHDRELAAGFMLGEGIVDRPEQIIKFENTGPDQGDGETNQLCVHLAEDVPFDFGSLQRNFYTTSSCGICGKASLDAVRAQLGEPIGVSAMKVEPNTICSLPESLLQNQQTFAATGGLHAAGLFHSASGEIVCSFEDVGRHNALDKLIGSQFLAGKVPMSDCIVVVSGRASFELVQKVVSAGAPMLVAVGAPSSLAVELADEFGVTLIGFTSESRFNIYCHGSRVAGSSENS